MQQKVVMGSRAMVSHIHLRLAAALRRRLRFLLASCLLMAVTLIPTPAAAQEPILNRNPVFTHINIDQGLSDVRATAIIQDQAGFMWFATSNGLNRYDGYTIVAYRNDPANPHSLSSNFIDSLYEDRSGVIWAGTRVGLNAFDRRTEQFTRYLNDPADAHSLSNNAVQAIYEDRAGVLWIGTAGGLNRLDRASGNFTVYRNDPANPHSLSHDSVWDIYEDRAGVLWLATDGGGLNRFDRTTETFTQYRHKPDDPYSLSIDRLDCLFEDASGALWIGTFGGGLSVLDPARRTFTTYRRDLSVPTSLSEEYITDIVAGRAGLIWLGTIGGGVNIYNPQRQAFTLYRHEPTTTNSLASDLVDAVYEDQAGVLWVGTQDRGLDRFDRRTGQVVHYPPEPENPQGLGHPFIRALQQDQAGALWIGTYGGGLYRLDPASGRFTPYRHDPANPNSLSDDTIFAMTMDRTGVLWIATTFGGLNRLDPKTGTFTTYRNDPANLHSLSSDWVTAIVEDQAGHLWIGTMAGGGLNRLDPATGQVTRYQNDPQDPASLGDNNIFDLHLDRAGLLWIGLAGAGLDRFDPATGLFTHYREGDGLANERIIGILEDDQGGEGAAGNLWITTGRGLSKLDQDRQTFYNYGTSDGLPLAEFSRGRYKSRSGELLLGSKQGLIVFEPAALQDDRSVPPVVFTNFLLANQPVAIGPHSALPQAINQTDTITLTYADRVISFEFAALSYHTPHQNRYRYKLEGFDPDWIEVDSQRRLATYTNLDPGTYLFRVTGSNGAGVWNETGREITLIITPPWWATWWFRGLALALVIGTVAAGYLWRVNNLQVQQRQLEAQVTERTRELATKTEALAQSNSQLEMAKNQAETANRAKSTFLATMSHELRTPLNAILGFARLTVRDQNLAPEHRENITIIQRSGEHLLGLINDVLDLSKVEAGKMNLDQVNFDLYVLLDELETMFRQRTVDKGLRLRFDRTADLPRYIYMDEVKLRQVLINLLGNAIKFTQAGEVTLHISTQNGAGRVKRDEDSHRPSLILFEVEDTGPGIPPEEQERIFDAFVQITAGQQVREGTGLGLAISRQYVQLMGGSLTVRSEVGQGAVFTAAIPVHVVTAGMLEAPPASRQVVGLAPHQPAYRILIVDDKWDNRQLLVKLLSPLGFELRQANNGQEAVEMWRAWQPHLIWMDLRMPLMDGYEAARRIRAEATEVKPPVLLGLSASSLEEERDRLLAAGFDAFIRKPFHEAEIFEAIERGLGLQYLYAEVGLSEAVRSNQRSSATLALTPAALAALPVEVLAGLERAVLETDPSLIAQRIAQIRSYDPELAEALAALADEFEYVRILIIIQATRGHYA